MGLYRAKPLQRRPDGPYRSGVESSDQFKSITHRWKIRINRMDKIGIYGEFFYGGNEYAIRHFSETDYLDDEVMYFDRKE